MVIFSSKCNIKTNKKQSEKKKKKISSKLESNQLNFQTGMAKRIDPSSDWTSIPFDDVMGNCFHLDLSTIMTEGLPRKLAFGLYRTPNPSNSIIGFYEQGHYFSIKQTLLLRQDTREYFRIHISVSSVCSFSALSFFTLIMSLHGILPWLTEKTLSAYSIIYLH